MTIARPKRIAWQPGRGSIRRGELLAGRVIESIDDSSDVTILLLHGIASTQAQFDATWDALASCGTVVIPDLLGFGASLDRGRREFTLDDHLHALDDLLDVVGRGSGPLFIAGHSLGGALGVCLASRHADRVGGIVTWGAPLHRSAQSARDHVRAMGRVNALTGLDTPLAQITCRLLCPRPRLARPVYRAVRPTMPIPVLEGAMEHSWWSYIGAMHSIILDTPWQSAMGPLIDAEIPIHLVAGAQDRVIDQELMNAWAQRSSMIRFELVPDAGHELPIVDPSGCVEHVRSVLTQQCRSRP